MNLDSTLNLIGVSSPLARTRRWTLGEVGRASHLLALGLAGGLAKYGIPLGLHHCVSGGSMNAITSSSASARFSLLYQVFHALFSAGCVQRAKPAASVSRWKYMSISQSYHLANARERCLCNNFASPRFRICICLIISSVSCCHFSHACESFRFAMRLSAPANMNCCLAISSASYCHFSHACDSLRFCIRLKAPASINACRRISSAQSLQAFQPANIALLRNLRAAFSRSFRCSLISAQTCCHCSHAIDSFRWTIRRTAPAIINFWRLICTACNQHQVCIYSVGVTSAARSCQVFQTLDSFKLRILEIALLRRASCLDISFSAFTPVYTVFPRRSAVKPKRGQSQSEPQ